MGAFPALPKRGTARCIPFLFLFLAAGCSTISPPDDLRRNAVAQKFFTPEAGRVLRHVPLRYAPLPGYAGIAIGNDTGSRATAILQGFGNRRQVVMSPNSDDITLFHEFIHQCQYSGLIDTALFEERYAKLKRDPRFARIPERWEEYLWRDYGRSPALAALLYDRGVTRELIAYLIEGWMLKWYDLPEYMLDVYRPAVRFESRDEIRP
jgi:hypothetical protein